MENKILKPILMSSSQKNKLKRFLSKINKESNLKKQHLTEKLITKLDQQNLIANQKNLYI